MRVFSLLIVVTGLLLAVAYPFVVENFGGYSIGRYDVFAKDSGYRAVEAELSDEEDPVRVLVDYTTKTQLNAVMASAALMLTVSRDGAEVLSKRLEFIHSTPGENSVQSGVFVYRASGGVLHPDGTGRFLFVLEPDGPATLVPERVVLILMASAIEWDPRGQSLGMILIAAGIIGFVVAHLLRQGKMPEAPRRWGRGGDSDS